MADYGLPKPPDKHRWFLATFDLEYAKLILQRKTILGWQKVHTEMVALHSDYKPFEVDIKEKANKCLVVIQDPKVSYGVIT